MSRKRKTLSLRVKLAAALLQLVDRDRGYMPFISFYDAQKMTADQIISLFQWDHYPIRHIDGGPDEPWNLEPKFIVAHRIKTATVDRPQIAKDRRVHAKHMAHVAKMNEFDLAKPPDTSEISEAKAEWFKKASLILPPKQKRKWPSRPFPKRKKK